tara:strand:+ start:2681 stop:3268 length:588 start_codon:yes stop_codon:yes gene_type:complete
MVQNSLADIYHNDRPALAAPVRQTALAILRAACAMSVFSLALSSAWAQDETLAAPEGEIVLTMTGNISRTNRDDMAVFDRAMLTTLPAAVLETSTVVTDGTRRFDGFLMRDLLESVGAQGEVVTATALNDYVIDIPMDDFEQFDVLVATHMDGEALLPSDKGPLWIVYPRDDHAELQDIRYDYRWVWQLLELDVK